MTLTGKLKRALTGGLLRKAMASARMRPLTKRLMQTEAQLLFVRPHQDLGCQLLLSDGRIAQAIFARSSARERSFKSITHRNKFLDVQFDLERSLRECFRLYYSGTPLLGHRYSTAVYGKYTQWADEVEVSGSEMVWRGLQYMQAAVRLNWLGSAQPFRLESLLNTFANYFNDEMQGTARLLSILAQADTACVDALLETMRGTVSQVRLEELPYTDIGFSQVLWASIVPDECWRRGLIAEVEPGDVETVFDAIRNLRFFPQPDSFELQDETGEETVNEVLCLLDTYCQQYQLRCIGIDTDSDALFSIMLIKEHDLAEFMLLSSALCFPSFLFQPEERGT